MRWDDQHSSPDLIDRRGARGGGGLPMGLLYLLPWLLRSPLGWAVILLFGGYFLCTNLLSGTDARDKSGDSSQLTGQGGGPADRDARLVGFVLDDTQDTWTKVFEERGETYERAKLVLFTDSTRTGCGYGQAATGPFYCPLDRRVYIDLGFYDELSGKLGARGEFAKAYVVAHEIGHHVQKLLGTSDQVHELGDTKTKTRGEAGASVRLELQADCFAGIWAHSTAERKLLEQGDIESALTAAQAIGDDRLQRMSKGTVSPEKWTHGSSAQRTRWFQTGYRSGRMADCDTFGATDL